MVLYRMVVLDFCVLGLRMQFRDRIFVQYGGVFNFFGILQEDVLGWTVDKIVRERGK